MKNMLFLCAFLFSLTGFAQQPIFTTAKVKSATVYYNGAELSHAASVYIPAGTSEIVIRNVANRLDENTIQVAVPASVTVMSVQFTTNYISEYDDENAIPGIKVVRDSIKRVQKEIAQIGIEKNVQEKTLQLLDKNQQVAGANTGMSVTELMKLVEYYKTKQTEISKTIVVLQDKQELLNKRLQVLNARLETSTQKGEKMASGKLVLQVMNDSAGTIPFEVGYTTPLASWSPFYDLRADNISSPINLMYKARVVQNTGVDWKKVKLTLSNGSPNRDNQAPELQPWFLNYNYPVTGYSSYAPAALRKVEGRVSDSALEEVAMVKKEKASVSNYTTIKENQLNVTFDIDLPYDILSNGKMHSVALKALELPVSYKYYAAPKVEKEAFLMADIIDYSKYNLLPGEANIIFEGLNIGKTVINPERTSDTLSLSMGRDKKIVITREKIADKSGTKFMSSYKEQTFTYDIVVRNTKKEAITMLLKDQFPLSTDKEIMVELLQSDKAKINTETGLLTWDLKLSPNETKKIRISYKVKYPKDRILGNLYQ